MRPASVGFHCPDDVREATRTVRQPRTAFGGRMTGSDEVTKILIGLNVAVFALTSLTGASVLTGRGASTLLARFSLQPGRVLGPGGFSDGVAQGQYWRLATAMFLHYGVFHILTNMYVLFLVGPPLERALGRSRYLAVYLLAGLGGSVLSYALGSVYEQSAGASGAIFGLFGAYYVVARRMGAQTGPIVATVAINLLISLAVPFIDIRGHIGGLITGALMGAVLAHAPRSRRTLWQAAGGVLIVVVLVVAVAVRTSQIREIPSQAGPLPSVQFLQR